MYHHEAVEIIFLDPHVSYCFQHLRASLSGILVLAFALRNLGSRPSLSGKRVSLRNLDESFGTQECGSWFSLSGVWLLAFALRNLALGIRCQEFGSQASREFNF